MERPGQQRETQRKESSQNFSHAAALPPLPAQSFRTFPASTFSLPSTSVSRLAWPHSDQFSYPWVHNSPHVPVARNTFSSVQAQSFLGPPSASSESAQTFVAFSNNRDTNVFNFSEVLASGTMPPLRGDASAAARSGTVIDLTEDDDTTAANPPQTSFIPQAQPPSLARQSWYQPHHNTYNTSIAPEVIDLESPEQSRLQAPSFIEPDATPGRHHHELNYEWEHEPDVQITGHSVFRLNHSNLMSLPSNHSSSHRHSHRSVHRMAHPRQPPTSGPPRTTIGIASISRPMRIAERIMRHVGGAANLGRLPILDYGYPAFDISRGRTSAASTEGGGRTAQQQIEPLPPAREGFTRAPVVDESAVPVCPNCEMELCVGDTETKRQVYAVKGCGHVYCGECALNRHKAGGGGRGKGKEPASGSTRALRAQQSQHNTFTHCVVEGCTQNTRTKGSMVQLFL